ncbi:MAG: LeuA family protein [Desulfovibrionaceae bacterium]
MLIDTTLREGEQFYGAYFDSGVRRRILTGLADLGVDEIELGCAGREDLPELAAWARRHLHGPALGVWCRCHVDDLCLAASLPVDWVNVGVPVSDAHIGVRLGTTRVGLLEQLATAMDAAKAHGIAQLSVGLEDFSRADPGFALKVAALAARLGARRVRLSDTVGIFAPADLAARVRPFADLGLAVAVHCHNDLGMATANAVSALLAGATHADVSILGLGERAGIAALEQVATFCTERGLDHYRLDGVRELCALAARAAGLPIPRNAPVAGRDVFACESGLHVAGLAKDPALFEPFAPERVGAVRVVGVGAKSGQAAVRDAGRRLGVAVPDHLWPRMVAAVRATAGRVGRPLRDHELVDIFTQNMEVPPCFTNATTPGAE